MVGELATLNDDRFEIRTESPPTRRSRNILKFHTTLHQAVDLERAQQTTPTPSNIAPEDIVDLTAVVPEDLGDPTTVALSPNQLQEIGVLFSRNPSALQPVILRMWYTSDRRPDVSAIVSPPSLLVS